MISTASSGCSPDADSADSITASCAVVDRRRDVGGLGRGGHRRGDHRLQHLGGDDHRLAGAAAGAQDAPLDGGHLLGAHLDPQVAARHHDAVGLPDDGVELRDRHRLLELGHDPGAVADQRARFVDILRPLHERQGDPVGAELEAVFEVAAVLGVSGDSGMIASGMLTPLRSESLPPTMTRAIA
jgi:hypothetical protein